MNILVIDLGGTNIKVRCSAHKSEETRRIASGASLTPDGLVDRVGDIADHWIPDVIALGYPGEVRDGRPSLEPNHLGRGWVGFDFAAAFRRPVRIINDAAMQALGSYQGGRMLFLGLGTGLGSAMVVEHVVLQMELSQLPYKDGASFGDVLRQSGLDRLGLDLWREEVGRVTRLLRKALVADYVVLGGGNTRHIAAAPPHARIGDNANAFEGGFRLWRDPRVRF